MNYLYDKETGEKLSGVYEKDGIIYRRDYVYFDAMLMSSENGIELLKYPEPFRVPKCYALDDEFCGDLYTDYEFSEALSTQKWKMVDGVVAPVDSSVRVSDLIASRKLAAVRSKKRFYNYAMGNNKWQYFCTWTFSDNKVRSDKDLLFNTYNLFIKTVRKHNSDVKALAVYEEFEKGGYHMHALLGNCRLRLVPGINPHNGEFVYSCLGHQVFNCLDWTYGFSNVVCIHPESEKLQVVNYLGSYLTKDCPAPYRCKRFFHTQNLESRDTYMFSLSDMNEPLLRMLQSYKGSISEDESVFSNLCNAFGLKYQKQSRSGVAVYRSNVNIDRYLDCFPDVFIKSK